MKHSCTGINLKGTWELKKVEAALWFKVKMTNISRNIQEIIPVRKLNIKSNILHQRVCTRSVCSFSGCRYCSALCYDVNGTLIYGAPLYSYHVVCNIPVLSLQPIAFTFNQCLETLIFLPYGLQHISPEFTTNNTYL